MGAPILSGRAKAPWAMASTTSPQSQALLQHRPQAQHKSQAQTVAVTVPASLKAPAGRLRSQVLGAGVPTDWKGMGRAGERRRVGRAVCAVAPPSVPAEKLSEPELATWQASVGLLTALGLGEEDADVALRKAFGWRDRSYWRDEIVDQLPEPSTVSGVLDFLKESCGMEDKDILALLKEFPQVLACSLEKRLKPNVEYLDKKWRINGSSLKGVLLRNPLVLGYTVDCGGDCIAECDYCWARF